MCLYFQMYDGDNTVLKNVNRDEKQIHIICFLWREPNTAS